MPRPTSPVRRCPAAYRNVIRSAAGLATEMALMAQWMTAESFYYQKSYEAASREYLSLATLCSGGWQAAALLAAAKCQELLGQTSVAADSTAAC